MKQTRRIVVATHNKHKVEEIRAILDIPGWELISLGELGIDEEPIEDADTFIGNARIKARFAHEKTGLAALADDSGLAVDALDGAPGVFSARYAGPDASDGDNNAKLLVALKGVPEVERTAHFHCAVVFINEDGTETVAEGSAAGRIGFEQKGTNGFGYDPLFCLETYHYQRTMAELDATEKNTLSHRFKALLQLKETLSLSSLNSPLSEIVAFDFDGTLIATSSPVKLIGRLNRDRIMPRINVLRSLVWGIWYKLGVERDQRKPRRYLFSSFKNSHASDANAIMRNLYTEELRNYLRPQALAALKAHRALGRHIIVVSASFEPIIEELCEELGIEDFICTRMEIVDGSYTGETLTEPPESTQKLLQFTQWANARFGTGGWVLTHAYGDHHSDVPLIETALHPIAIDPDKKLDAIAKKRGWEIHEWPLSQKPGGTNERDC